MGYAGTPWPALRYPGAEQDGAARAALAGLLELRRVLAAFASPFTADRLVRGLVERSLSIDEAIATAGRHRISSPAVRATISAPGFRRRSPLGRGDDAGSAARSTAGGALGLLLRLVCLLRIGGIFLLVP